jgi:proton-dependent oligopeptide transporter, POT family
MSADLTASEPTESTPTLFGHPTGLYNLFFAEMWERFSYYGMRALLVLYMLKGFLQYNDKRAYAVYGAYTALVYMTPFFGGLLADRLLGARIAVIIGGVLMAFGHLVMMWQNATSFYVALTLLIIGNGFFKPNISAIVGTLYPPASRRQDGGFTIFYMGVNLGAAMSPLLCGYIGEKYGWHLGFGLATIGMMVGLAVFVMPNLVTQALIALAAGASAIALFRYHIDNSAAILLNTFVAACLMASAVISIIALSRGGLPAAAGRFRGGAVPLRKIGIVLGGVALLIPVVTLFVSEFSVIRDGEPLSLIGEKYIEEFRDTDSSTRVLEDGTEEIVRSRVRVIGAVLLDEVSRPAGLLLTITFLPAFGFLILQTVRLNTVARHRMFVVLIMTFFSLLFWALFEQAGSSLNTFADRNVDRVSESSAITEDDVGSVIQLEPTQEQLGYTNGGVMFTMDQLDKLRAPSPADASADDLSPDHDAVADTLKIEWAVDGQNVGMGIASRDDELPASVFQSVNPVCILIFGLVFSALWTYMGVRGREPSIPVKFSMGLLQLGLGFGVMWYGTTQAGPRGMMSAQWLVLGYMLHTTGELCLSPVGLSMVTKLSPKVLVSTVMGAWFLATAMSQYLAAIISQFTKVESETGVASSIPIPSVTLPTYGGVFGVLAIAGVLFGLVCLCLSPLLSRWTHLGEPFED